MRKALAPALGIAAAILLALFTAWIWRHEQIGPRARQLWDAALAPDHIIDEAGIFPADEAAMWNEYTRAILRESDVDVRLLTVPSTGDRTLERLAVEKMNELGVGGASAEERGVLLLYDAQTQELRLEVGYSLERCFPDSFVGYLVREHARHFFGIGDVTHALGLLVRMLHTRIREQTLGLQFDPAAVSALRAGGNLSGGAGAAGRMPAIGGDRSRWFSRMGDAERERFTPGATPEAAYRAYLAWLAAGRYDPEVGIFTASSRGFLASQSSSRAYGASVFLAEFGRAFRIVERGNLALLYFTDSPLLSPHFFRRDDEGWRVDIVAEVDNTRELVGVPYTWMYSGRDDDFTKAFFDLLEPRPGGVVRIVGGDNRGLPVRG